MSAKVSYVGAPACFALEMACKHVRDAFDQHGDGRRCGIYIVGSALERADWRDVDVRLMLDDASFVELFPRVDLSHSAALWEFDPRWTLINVSVAAWMRQQTGLPVDFQIQPMTWANKHHGDNKPRAAAGLTFVDPRRELPEVGRA